MNIDNTKSQISTKQRSERMIKGISAKTCIAGLMLLAGSLGMRATNPIKTVKPESNQTEVVSREGAEAMKSLSLQQVNQTQVPTVHNPKLDNMLRKFIETPEEKAYYENIINNVYKLNGTFLGSAVAQHEIDLQTFYAFMTKNTKMMKNNNINPELAKKIESFGPDFFKTVTPKEKEATDWAFDIYTPLLNANLKFDHKPTADEVLIRLDNIAREKSGLNKNELIDYYVYSRDFETIKINNKKDTQSQSDLIAYKMFMIDRLVMERILRNAEVIGGANFRTGDINNPFSSYFVKWMESTQPTGN